MEIPLTKHEMVVGRPSNESTPDISVKDRLVSRRHAIISRDEKGYYIRNFGQNGTVVNGQEIDVVYLKDGDRIEIGSTHLKFASRVGGQIHRALIVDACQLDALLIQEILSELAFECEIVEDGETAWKKLLTSGCGLMVVDVMVSKIDGFELCRKVRNHPNLQGLPIIVLSHMSHDPEIAHGLLQGADDYLAKPVRQLEFQARVKKLMALSGGT